MRRIVALCAVSTVLWLGVGGVPPASAQASADLEVVDGGGARVDVVIELGPGRTSGSTRVQLRSTGTTALKVSALKVQLDGGVQATATFDAGDPLAMVAPGSSVGITVEAPSVTAAGSYRGSLSAKVGSGRAKLADVLVTRRDASPLTLNGKTDTVTLPVTAAAQKAFELRLQNTGAAAVRAELEVPAFETAAGPTATETTIVWPDPSEPGLLAPGSVARVQIDVALPRDGATYTSNVVPIADGRPQSAISVSLQRTSEKPVQLVNGDAGYAFEIDQSELRVAILIQNTLTVDVDEVQVFGSSLTGPEVVAIEVTVGGASSDEPFSIPAGEVREVVITASIVGSGTYTGSIRVLVGPIVNDLAALKVDRKIVGTQVTATASPSRRDVLAPVKSTTHTARVVLTDDSGTTGQVCVTITAVDAKEGSSGDVASARLTDLVPLGPVPAEREDADLECSGVVVQLLPRTPTAFRAELADLPVPGSYEVTFSVSDGSRTAVTDGAELTLRRSGWWAIALIMTGAITSFLVTQVAPRRAKARQGRRIAQVREWLNQSREPLVQDVVNGLRTRADAVAVQVAQKAKDADLRTLSLLRQATLLRPYAAAVRGAHDAGITPTPPAIAEARTLMLAADMDEAAQASAQAKLDAAGQAIFLALRHRQQLSDLKEMTRQAKDAGLDTAAVDVQLRNAEGSLAAGARADLEQALRAAERAFREPLAEALEKAAAEHVTDDATPAQRADIASIKTRSERVVEDLRGDSKATSLVFTAYTTTRSQLAKSHAAAIRASAEASEADALTPNAAGVVSSERRTAALHYRASYESAKRALEAVTLARTLHFLAESRVELNLATTALGNAVPEAAAASPAPATLAPGTTPVDDTATGAGAGASAVAPFAVGDLTGRLSLLAEAAIALVAFFVAGLLGWQVLWNSNPTWGSWATMVAAFLWGFGLTQATYTGIRPLMTTISGEPE